MSFRCVCCGEIHDVMPDIGADRPDCYWAIPDAERDSRIELSEDTCVIDAERFFIRGVIEIPIHNSDRRFGFGVWVSQRKENFQTYLENLDSGEIGPFFGWLSTKLNYYADETLLLKTMAHFHGDGDRPTIELEPTDHPLAAAQQNGISEDEAWRIIHHFTDGHPRMESTAQNSNKRAERAESRKV